jgi:hypothetical protein
VNAGLTTGLAELDSQAERSDPAHLGRTQHGLSPVIHTEGRIGRMGVAPHRTGGHTKLKRDLLVMQALPQQRQNGGLTV